MSSNTEREEKQQFAKAILEAYIDAPGSFAISLAGEKSKAMAELLLRAGYGYRKAPEPDAEETERLAHTLSTQSAVQSSPLKLFRLTLLRASRSGNFSLFLLSAVVWTSYIPCVQLVALNLVQSANKL